MFLCSFDVCITKRSIGILPHHGCPHDRSNALLLACSSRENISPAATTTCAAKIILRDGELHFYQLLYRFCLLQKSFKLINRDLLNILVEMVNVSGSHMHAVWDSQIHMHAEHCIIVLNLQLFMQMMMSLEKLCKHSV